MSVRAMTWAWEMAEACELTIYQAMVLLRLSDHANDQGACWPGKDRLAGKCRCSKRKVDEVIQELAGLDLLSIQERSQGGRSLTHQYQLNVGQQPLFRAEIDQNNAQRAGMHSVQGCTPEQKTLHTRAENPAQRAPESSYNHQEPPNARAREPAAAIDYEKWQPDDTILARIRMSDPAITDAFIETERLEFVTFAEDNHIRENLLRTKFSSQVRRHWREALRHEGNRGPLREIVSDIRNVPVDGLETWSRARDGPRPAPGESADDYRKRIIATLSNRDRNEHHNPAIAQLAAATAV
jgi:hypothetical protein